MAEIEIGAWQGLSNVGGIRRLRLVRLVDVLAFNPPITGSRILPGCLVLSDDAELVDIRFADRTGSFQVNESENEAGESYDVQIAADIPKIRTDVTGFLRDRSQHRWISFVDDRNGNCLMLGSPECNGLKLLWGIGSGSKGSDRNSQRLSLQGFSWQPVWFTTQAEFSTEFSTEFLV